MGVQSLVIRLSEPELWAVVRAYGLTPTSVSPLRDLLEDADTLDEVVDAGRASLARRELADGERINGALAAVVRVLCEPDERLEFVERGNLGTRDRRFYGRRELFVEYARSAAREHGFAFPWTRGGIAAMAARAMGLEVTS